MFIVVQKFLGASNKLMYHCSQCYKGCATDWWITVIWHYITTGSFRDQDSQLMLLIIQLGHINLLQRKMGE